MGQIIKYDENKTNNELIKYGNSLIGANSTNTLFNEKDMQADVDSINLSKQISNSFYIEIINYYYKENDVRKNNMREYKKYLLEKENSQTIYEAVKNNFSKNKVYINALINSLTNSNIAQKYKENQEKYIEIMAQIFENYFLNPEIMSKLGVIESEDAFYEILYDKWREYLHRIKSGVHLIQMMGRDFTSPQDMKEHMEEIKTYMRGHNLFDIFYGRYKKEEKEL